MPSQKKIARYADFKRRERLRASQCWTLRDGRRVAKRIYPEWTLAMLVSFKIAETQRKRGGDTRAVHPYICGLGHIHVGERAMLMLPRPSQGVTYGDPQLTKRFGRFPQGTVIVGDDGESVACALCRQPINVNDRVTADHVVVAQLRPCVTNWMSLILPSHQACNEARGHETDVLFARLDVWSLLTIRPEIRNATPLPRRFFTNTQVSALRLGTKKRPQPTPWGRRASLADASVEV